MANRPSPNSLIHCNKCGEDYSATYKRCPFCGAKNSSQQADSDRSASGSDLEDTYVFDGQDLFDDEPEENDAPAYPKGGKRLAEKSFSNPFANADINWPRVITFICSLIIIVAAMVIVFTVVYPQLRGNKDPVVEGSTPPSAGATDQVNPSGNPSEGPQPSESAEPSQGVEPSQQVSNKLTGIKLSSYDFTLTPKGTANDHYQLKATFTPSSWSGEVTWSSSDERYATVDSKGVVTNVNTTNKLRGVVITATAGGISVECKVYCRGVPDDPEPTNSNPSGGDPTPTPSAGTDPTPTPTTTGSGTVTVGKKGTIVNAGKRGDPPPTGVLIRSEPKKDSKSLGGLFDGDSVTVLEDAGDGWYKISSGSTTGYIMGTFISTN